MTADALPWTVHLTKTAESEFQSIMAWTLREFGDVLARIYADTLSAALLALTAGPTTVVRKSGARSVKGFLRCMWREAVIRVDTSCCSAWARANTSATSKFCGYSTTQWI
jgi:plasmid stabilization system protein ParE